MHTKYTVFERDSSGEPRRIREVLGALERHHDLWVLQTQERTIPGTLKGDPLSAHVFTDEAGRDYRVT
jgi:hypothetical protein